MAEQGESSGDNSTSALPIHTPVDILNVPTTALAGVLVLDSTHQEDDETEEKPLSNEHDLWLSTVHKDILTKAEWFRKALCGNFREAGEQVVDLPEEDPAIFHFLVAFLYENRFDPIKPAASALDPPLDKGKGLDIELEAAESSDSSTSSSSSGTSSNSDASGRVWQNRHRRLRGNAAGGNNQDQEKRPGIHRPGCGCPTCMTRLDATACWHCGMRRLRPPQAGARLPPAGVPPRPQANIINVRPTWPRPANPTDTVRIDGEDMRTWLMAYELNLDVYICANRYLMEDFGKSVMRSCIDMLETAGIDAAHPQVLRLCRKLYAGVPEDDQLLKMVLARVGFLQPTLWKKYPQETSEFLVENPELAAAILRETVMRHEANLVTLDLPSMEAS
ncbi:hypothetical protein BGZ63DRAFT_347275 [Mariannaea sp. PMI_226]|nr:hypothetical protein BGZ63DRAFT_347275 [Mariannaea sp. PMI_226]